MIKFWKSAAKGKSGFPVRPPEPQIKGTSIKLLETIHENEDAAVLFEKKSRLSPQLQDVLKDKNSTKYFVHFMQSIGKLLLIKCWLELENFRISVLNTSKSTELRQEQSKLNRAKSFDLDWSSKCDNNLSKHTESKNRSVTSKLQSIGNSSSSYHNLLDIDNVLGSGLSEENIITNVTDAAVNLFKKYVALEAPNQLNLTDEVRKTVISNICQPQGEVSHDCFKPIQEVLFQDMERYFEDFQNSPFYMKAQIDILTSGSLSPCDILYNETILFYFTEYLEQESCSVFLEFIMSVMNFRDNIISNNISKTEQAQQDAIVIYEKYFSLQATNPVGFSTDVRLQVESEICREGGPLHSCFDSSYQIVYNTLKQCVKTFMESEVYFKYLSEMINSVEKVSHRRSQSDCSSEFSLSTQNTLLAMGDPVFQRKKRNLSVPDMTIDSNQLYNADSLWQRRRHDGLSLGRVNSLGRFESKFEPDPDKKEKSVLKKMVSRFVPSNNKVEEEMAWQIAHMIVKDVTDLTMAPPDNEREDS